MKIWFKVILRSTMIYLKNHQPIDEILQQLHQIEKDNI